MADSKQLPSEKLGETSRCAETHRESYENGARKLADDNR
jgi:hypothetical protein